MTVWFRLFLKRANMHSLKILLFYSRVVIRRKRVCCAGGISVIDLEHMPSGCGTWPAFWSVGPNWPSAGEIDIIEGVNRQARRAWSCNNSFTGRTCLILPLVDVSFFIGHNEHHRQGSNGFSSFIID